MDPTTHKRTRKARASAVCIPDAPVFRSAGPVISRRAAKIPPLFRRKKDLRIACWNVRTLRDDGVQALTMRMLHKYGVHIACLSEVRLPDFGHQRIKVPGENISYHLYHSGVSDNSGLHGVAIALSPDAQAALLAWQPVSYRLAMVRLKGQISNISVITVYAPTLIADEVDKARFYADLQTLVDSVPSRDVLIVAGDWNARTGPADDATRHILGRFALGDRCDNGERLVSFADANRLVVTNTRFQHPRRHLVTWRSNDGRTANQIDYILVKSRWANSVMDSRAYRGAVTGSEYGSDHTLVRATLRLRLKATPPPIRQKRIDVSQLKLGCGNGFRLELQNRFEMLSKEVEDDPELEWNDLKTATVEAAKEHLGSTYRRHRDWISSSTLALAEKARLARLQGASNLRDLRRRASRAIRADRNAHWRQFAEQTERAAACGDSRKLYQLLKQASRTNSGTSETICDRNGTVITSRTDRLARWREHFSELLNHAPPLSTPFMASCGEEYGCSTTAPTVEEVLSVLKSLRNNKAPGEDGIPAEIYKAEPDIFAAWLHRVFSVVWATERFPGNWSEATLLPFFKKGDKKLCSNYRGISLIDVAAKAFATLLLKRFQATRDIRTRPSQAGFRPGKSCIDQIFNLRRVLEQRWAHQQPSVLCFIDFAAAFDSVDREALWRIMQADGIPLKLLRLIQGYYRLTRVRVKVYGEETELFDVGTGVRQGCVLSPILFNYAIDYILNTALKDYSGVEVGRGVLATDLAYADDVVLLGANRAEVQAALSKVHATAAAVGLRINTAKSKVLRSLIPADDWQPLSLEDVDLEDVESFVYLGSTMVPTGQGVAEVERRIGAARSAFGRLRRCLWSRREITSTTKGRIYQAVVRTILLYGCETWPMRVADQRRLEVFDNDCLRSILHYRRLDRVPTATLRQRLSLRPLPSVLLQRRLRWFGHAARRPVGNLTRDVLQPPPLPNWRKRTGGQLKTWAVTLKEDLSGLSGPEVVGLRRWNRDWLSISIDLSQDRRAWAAMVRDVVKAREEAGSTRPG